MAFLTDSSTNNFQLTAYGNAALNTTTFKYGGGSAYFDGNGDYLSVSAVDAFEFDSGDFTIEAWIYATTISSPKAIISKGDPATVTDNVWTLEWNGTSLTFFGPAGLGSIVVAPNFSTNTWYHVAVTREGSTYRIFKDGNLEQTATNSNAILRGGPVIIGAGWYDPVNRSYNGYIDDLRITKGVARYTSNFTPPDAQLPDPSDPYREDVSLLLHMDGLSGSTTFIDSSTNNFQLTAVGNAQISTVTKKFGNGAAYFDGNGDYLEVVNDSAFNFGTNNFTVELWIYPLSYGSGAAGGQFFGTTNGSTTGWSFNLGESVDRLRLISNLGGSWADNLVVSSGTGPLLNVWSHIALVRDGNTIRIFVNGQIAAQGSGFSSFNFLNNINIIGRFNDGTNLIYYNGYIDELRITKGVARYTSNFVPQTAPFANPNPTPDPWQSVLNSSYKNNIIAAYDFREIDGTTLNGKIGPSLTLNNVTLNSNGGAFTYGSSNAVSNSTVNLTYPHTILFIAKGSFNAGEINYMSMSAVIDGVPPMLALFSRTFQSIMPYNGVDNEQTQYDPDDSEWFYVAASFLNDGTVRYAVRAISSNLNGTLNASNGNSGFNAYPLFGKWFGNNFAFPGTIRLAVSINQGFSTEQQMNELFDTFKIGPASDLTLE